MVQEEAIEATRDCVIRSFPAEHANIVNVVKACHSEVNNLGPISKSDCITPLKIKRFSQIVTALAPKANFSSKIWAHMMWCQIHYRLVTIPHPDTRFLYNVCRKFVSVQTSLVHKPDQIQNLDSKISNTTNKMTVEVVCIFGLNEIIFSPYWVV